MQLSEGCYSPPPRVSRLCVEAALQAVNIEGDRAEEQLRILNQGHSRQLNHG